MNKKVVLSYAFHPVGQGLFASGNLTWGENEFSWVYDCGSFKPSLLDSAIKEYHNDNQNIDLLAISHFDDDHINGLSRLLRGQSIKYLLLPYLNLDEKIFLLLSACQNGILSVNTAMLIHSVQSFFLNNDLPLPRKIIYALSNNQEEDRGQENIDLSEDSPVRDEKQHSPKESLQKSNNLYIKNGRSLTVFQIWQFIPYNDMKIHKHGSLSFDFKEDTEELIRDFLAKEEITRKETEVFIKTIKKQYRRIMSISSDVSNKMSLCLFGGLVPCQYGVFFPWELKTLKQSHYMHCYSQRWLQKHGIMYTGDISLKSQYALLEFCRFYHSVLDNIFCFQVMHHGARENSQSGVAEKLAPTLSIFSADPNYKYHHPHKEVLMEFMETNLILVNDYGMKLQTLVQLS